MKGSKLLLVVIFLVTIGLGGAAVYIGYRLSREEKVTPTPSEAYEDECDSGSDCHEDCEWPSTNYCECGHPGGGEDNKCACRTCNAQGDCAEDPSKDGCDWFCAGYDYCTDHGSGCDPGDCPTGWTKCGTSISCREGDDCTGCTETNPATGDDFGSCTASSAGCSNQYSNKLYCKQEEEEETLTCESLTSSLGSTITLQKGDTGSATLTATTGGTIDTGITYTFGVDSGFGTVAPTTATDGTSYTGSSWSITAAQSGALSTGTHTDVIYVTVSSGTLSDGGKGTVCALDVIITETPTFTCGDTGCSAGTCSDGTVCHNDICSRLCSDGSYVHDKTNDCTCPTPSFEVAKTSSQICVNEETALEVTYTITVTNVSSVSGKILSVADHYDDNIQATWISNINPTPDSHSNHIITWNNNGLGYTIAAGASVDFSYVVTIPTSAFGQTFTNVVTVTPEEGSPITAEHQVEGSCVPPTGVFDSAVTSGLIALLLITIGGLMLRYEQYFWKLLGVRDADWSISTAVKKFRVARKERFEKRMLKKVKS